MRASRRVSRLTRASPSSLTLECETLTALSKYRLDNTFLANLATETRAISAQAPPDGARTGTYFCVIIFSIVPVAPLIEHNR